jgi:hypothetical protein
MQPPREFDERKCKEMQMITSKIAFISSYFLGRIRTFQRVTEEKIKKSCSVSTRVLGCIPTAQTHGALSFSQFSSSNAAGSGEFQIHST